MTTRTPTLTLRAIAADDAEALGRFLQGLCPASRRQRFHGQRDPRALAAPMCRVDGVRHQAWLAWVGQGADARVVGEARFVIDAQSPGAAELAMVVADEWRGRGVADALMRQLLQAAGAAGVQQLFGDVLESNERMAAFMRRHGFESDLYACGEVLRLRRAPTLHRRAAAAAAVRWLGRGLAAAIAVIPLRRPAGPTLAAR